MKFLGNTNPNCAVLTNHVSRTIEIVSSNRLYEVILEKDSGSEGQTDVWATTLSR